MSAATADVGGVNGVGILMLAAGRSLRFGSDKRIARIPGSEHPLLETTLQRALDSGMPVCVCLRATDNALADTLLREGVSTAMCRRSHLGMGATLAEAVAGIQQWQAVVVALADMPLVRSSTYRALALACTRDTIAVPRYRGQRGNPVCFGAKWFSRLAQCEGDRGARDVLSAHPDALHLLDVDDPGILADVDLPGDLNTRR